MTLFISSLVFLVLLVCVVGCLVLLLFFHVLAAFWGAPYLPTQPKKIMQMIAMVPIRSGEKVVDLGSGDGRIVIALAKSGAEAHGYEINLFYVLLSRYKIHKAGVVGKAFIHWNNFWDVNLSSYDLVIIYGITYIMNRLEKKLQRELKPHAHVISNSYAFKTWVPIQRKNHLYVYEKSEKS